MAIYIQFFTDAHSLGSLYALMALGLVIVYGILKLVNFAYGELIMVSGYTLFLLGGTSFPWLAMADIAIIMAVITGIATEYVAFRPVRSKSVTAVLITSFAFQPDYKTLHYCLFHRVPELFRYRKSFPIQSIWAWQSYPCVIY